MSHLACTYIVESLARCVSNLTSPTCCNRVSSMAWLGAYTRDHIKGRRVIRDWLYVDTWVVKLVASFGNTSIGIY